jgi:hypothetical protein
LITPLLESLQGLDKLGTNLLDTLLIWEGGLDAQDSVIDFADGNRDLSILDDPAKLVQVHKNLIARTQSRLHFLNDEFRNFLGVIVDLVGRDSITQPGRNTDDLI